ncbi:MAG: hypothetical protein WA821_15550 [Anaerolineales bacterium]
MDYTTNASRPYLGENNSHELLKVVSGLKKRADRKAPARKNKPADKPA